MSGHPTWVCVSAFRNCWAQDFSILKVSNLDVDNDINLKRNLQQNDYGLFLRRVIPKGLTFGYWFKILCIVYVCFVLFFSQSWDNRYGLLDLKQSINQTYIMTNLCLVAGGSEIDDCYTYSVSITIVQECVSNSFHQKMWVLMPFADAELCWGGGPSDLTWSDLMPRSLPTVGYRGRRNKPPPPWACGGIPGLSQVLFVILE